MTRRRRAPTTESNAAAMRRRGLGPLAGHKSRTLRLSPAAIAYLDALNPLEIIRLRRLNGATPHVICK